MATLRASQILKSCIDFMRPMKADGEGIVGTIKNLTKLSKGPSGYELLSFPLMREQVSFVCWSAVSMALTLPSLT